MPLTINHNLMASNTARNLGNEYAALSTSTQRLSSGLRISRASDDAAGLAVRELMRSDITTLNQGIRNANDAISMIQTADGALQVIDEKLIRMKELAEQAATGTYNSDQRIIIDSEYQAMTAEITRIANSTDFNGIYLLNGNLSSSAHDGSGVNSIGKMKVHFGTGNSSAEDYYYVQIGCCTASALGLVLKYKNGVTEAQYVSTNNLTLWTPHQAFHDFGIYATGSMGTVADQFDPNTEVDAYWNNTITIFYYFAHDKSGNLHVFESDNGHNYIAGSDKIIQSAEIVNSSSISTQELAQSALDTIKNAIISKDKIRASLGATQNRLENTISNLQIQAENLQAAESQISDTDVAHFCPAKLEAIAA